MKKVILSVILAVTAATFVWAQSYDIREMTPVVQAALEARKARFSEIKEFKTKGFIGENNKGYVEAIGGNSMIKALVDAENKDRRSIYKTIVDQNNLGADALAAVEGAFADVQRNRAAAGEKIQDASGNWMVK